MAAIRKLDQLVRNLSHLEHFYDRETDRTTAASAFVELVATADAAANHLPVDAPGVMMHNGSYSTPSFKSPDLALAYSTTWNEEAWDLVNKPVPIDVPEEFRDYWESFRTGLKETLVAAPTAELPPLLDMKINCRRTTDGQSTSGRYPIMLHLSYADPSMGLPHRRFNDVMFECAHDQTTHALLPVRPRWEHCHRERSGLDRR